MPFEPGKSGNPGGRAKAKPYKDMLNLILLREHGDLPPVHKNNLEAVVSQHVRKALEGDMQAINGIADRLDGKPPQAVVGDADADPIAMVHQIQRIIVDTNSPNQDSPDIQAPPEGGPV